MLLKHIIVMLWHYSGYHIEMGNGDILTIQKTKLFPEFQAPVDLTLEARHMRFELMELHQQLRIAKDKKAINIEIQQMLAVLGAENLQLKQQQVEVKTLQAQLTTYDAKVRELEQQAP
ncbi:hypothetical protein RMA95_01215 [Acinetobacter sp. V110_1]|uniref:hypothetical protein n=1 Tax=Acinetobacter sp. V110_1 TaxID=3072988 RepID=UPI00287CE424|nr:hypothetical protein [Acinetobacter sp. V110_1]MDS7942531.1 hypothetical protein [Acinetobacter sp. V110_1]